MELFDTHAHLDSEAIAPQIDIVIARASEAGVVGVVSVGTSAASSQRAIELAQRFPQVWAAVGIQPNHVAEAATDDWSAIERLAEAPRVVAIGETGLDRYWNDTPFALQQDYFDRHLRLSQRVHRPFIVHMRDCQEDVLVMLREARARGPLRGIMHSYTGDLSGAEECLQLGLHISFAGMVTYKKSHDLREVAAAIPADRLLIETDSPYLSPHPHRAIRPNEPALVAHTLRCLADVRGVDAETLAAQTTRNARALFQLDPHRDALTAGV